MATNKEIKINGVMTPVTDFSHTSQEIDDATARALEGGGIDKLLAGKAPAGYGLGAPDSEFLGISNTSLNSLIKNGWYFLYTGNTDGPDGVNISYAILFVSSARSDLVKVQKLTLGIAGYQGYELRRFYNNSTGAWSEWEWLNPPMGVGVEYRTTERYNGKPVYVKLVDFGYLPSSGRKQVDHSISNIQNVIRCVGQRSNGDSIPSQYAASDHASIFASKSSIYIYVGIDMSATTATAQLWYTKTTD